jgi:hypothetical protein
VACAGSRPVVLAEARRLLVDGGPAAAADELVDLSAG